MADNTIVVFWGDKWAELKKLPTEERSIEQAAFYKARHQEMAQLLNSEQMKKYRKFQQARKKQKQN